MLGTLKYKVMVASAGAMLLVGGIAPVMVTHGQEPAPTTAATAQAEDPNTGPDTDNIQDAEGDQIGSQVEAGLPDTAESAEASAPDNDSIQQGGGTQVEDGLPDSGAARAEN